MSAEQFVNHVLICAAVIGVCIGVNLYLLCTWSPGFRRDWPGSRAAANVCRMLLIVVQVSLIYFMRNHLIDALFPRGGFIVVQQYTYLVIALACTLATLPYKPSTRRAPA